MKKAYYPHVDGLRAIAVIFVLLFHLGFDIGGGYVGVDIFLVISGFLITLLLKKEVNNAGTLNLGSFYIRRVKRILPALVVTLAISFLFSTLIFSPNHLQTIAGSLTSAMFGISNFYFWFEADYFDTSTKLKPFLHTWSLGVEEQFYLFWSLALFTAYKLRIKALIPLLILLAICTSIFLNYKLADGNSWFISKYTPALAELIKDGKSTLFYMLPFRIYEFGIGALLAWFYHLKISNKTANDFLFLIGICMIVYAGTQFTADLIFPYFYGLVPTIGAALIIYSGEGARVSKLLSNKLMVGIGLISYSLYLVHWPIISFYHYLGDEQELILTQQLSIVVLSFVLAFCLYRFVETPLRQPNYFKENKLRLATALGIFFVFSGAGYHAYKNNGWEWRVGEPIVNFEEMENSSEFHKKYYGGADYPYYGAVKTNKAPDMVILGDSHGRHYAEGVYQVIAKPNNYSLYIASGTSCFHLPNFTRTTKGHNWDVNCPKRLEIAKSYLEKSKKPPLVIISHSWQSQMGRADILDSSGKRIGIEVSIQHLKQGVLDLKEFIGSSKLVVIGDVPRAGTNLYDIFTRPRPLMFGGFNPEEYLYRERDPKLEEINAEFKRLAEETGGFIFIDPFDYLCDATRCRNLDDERRLIYSDAGHLSKYGSLFVIDAIKDRILTLLK